MADYVLTVISTGNLFDLLVQKPELEQVKLLN